MKQIDFTLGRRPWYLYLTVVYVIWAWLLFTGPGLWHYLDHWPIALVMIFGSMVAGFTPEGGGAIAYPILSIWFSLPSGMARDFSLAIQAIGMTSASIYILSSRRRSWHFYRHIPLYVVFNVLGLVSGLSWFNVGATPVLQMIFVSLALAFIAALWSVRRFGDQADFELRGKFRMIIVFLMCFLGGLASSMFGTGSDMLLYICLSCWFAMKEKEATDLSIITMAAISVIGILIRWLLMGDVDSSIYHMWLAAVPIVLLGAPLGNWLLNNVKKESMLLFLFAFNLWTFVWWSLKNPSLIWIAVPMLTTIYLLMTAVIHARSKSTAQS
jgi:uncharacterized membrane protein YfcA